MLNFIANARSGKGLGNKNLKKIIDFCNKRNIDFSVHITCAPGHAKELASTLSQTSDVIIAVGGDGTFHEVLGGIRSLEKTTLGFIPSGRGNDFAKGIGLPLDPIKAMEIIIKNKTRFIDYIQVDDKRCLNIGGTGLDIDVLKRVAGRQGKITYLKSLFYCVRHFEPYDIEVTLPDKEKVEYSAVIVGICNGKQFGGGLKLSPNSKFDDGIMELIIIKMPENKKITRPLIKFLSAKHLELPITTVIQCEEVLIHPLNNRPIQLDGEIYEKSDLNCKIVKGGLKTFAVD